MNSVDLQMQWHSINLWASRWGRRSIHPRQQVSEITIGNGLTGATTETYTVYIDQHLMPMRPQLDWLPTQ